MKLTDEQRFSIFQQELGLVHSSIDKYDAQIFSMRNWFVSLWTATCGVALASGNTSIFTLASLLAIFFLFIEGTIRRKRWYKYVSRYRTISAVLNNPDFEALDISIYDLTNNYLPEKTAEALSKSGVLYSAPVRKSYLKTEALLFYALFFCGGLALFAISNFK